MADGRSSPTARASRRWPVSLGDPVRRRAIVAVAVIVVGLALTIPAFGSGASVLRPVQERTSISGRAAAALARDAATDDGALRRLRSVGRIDGRPVNLDATLANLTSRDRPARVQALAIEVDRSSVAGPTGASSATSAEARREARRVLDGSKYQTKQLPRPFKGALEWLADRLRPVGRVLATIFRPVTDLLGLLPIGAVVILAGLAVGLLVWWLARRRSGTVLEPRRRSALGGRLVDTDLDPAALDEHAEAAEADGDLGAAVRLRYQAGLIRLVRAGRLDLRADTTASEAADQVGDPTVKSLTADFEAVAYGGRSATTADVDRSRHGWLDVVCARSRR